MAKARIRWRSWEPMRSEKAARSRKPLLVLERGLEVLESIGNRVSMAVDRESFSSESVPAQIASLSFLTRYSVATGEKKPMESAIHQTHRLCHSPLYDAVEGGFFKGVTHGKIKTSKLLSHNAQWLMLVLSLRGDSEATFALPMARGILHFLQGRLLLPGGGFGNAQREDPAYYALSGNGRRQVEAPPVDQTIYTASSALVLRALCEGWWVLGETEYLQMALDTFASLESWVEDSKGALSHAHGDRPLGEGTLEDTVQMGLAYLALYRATLEPSHLEGVTRMARRVIGKYKNPAGEGFLNAQLPAKSSGRPSAPLADPAPNARAASFLLIASAQLGDESLSVPALGILGALAASLPEDLESAGSLGNALLVALLPMAVYEAVTDGSEAQRSRVLERLRQVGSSLIVITHRLPAPREGMQRLPRLIRYCGADRHEIVI